MCQQTSELVKQGLLSWLFLERYRVLLYQLEMG